MCEKIFCAFGGKLAAGREVIFSAVNPNRRPNSAPSAVNNKITLSYRLMFVLIGVVIKY